MELSCVKLFNDKLKISKNIHIFFPRYCQKPIHEVEQNRMMLVAHVHEYHGLSAIEIGGYSTMDSMLHRGALQQPYSINGAESYLTSRSASDSSAWQLSHQPPYNLLVSLSCFRGHIFITSLFSLFNLHLFHLCYYLKYQRISAILFSYIIISKSKVVAQLYFFFI